MSDTRVLYALLVALVAIQRLVELSISARHRRYLLAHGGVEVGASHYPWMVALHAGLLAAAPTEVWWLSRPWRPWLGWSMLVLFALLQVSRAWIILTLKERWTTRIVVVPGASLTGVGPYRYLRHPNYLVVALEVPALPLIHGAWLTALLFGAANLLVLGTRIRVEEAALRKSCDHDASLGRGRS